MANISNDTDRQAAGIALWSPPHRRIARYSQLRDSGKLEKCDALHDQMKRDHAAWKEIVETNNRAESVLTSLFLLVTFFSTLDEFEPADFDAEKKAESKYLKTRGKYESTCLGKTEPVAQKAKRGIMHRTWDAIADGVVCGGRFMADHPTEVAIGIGVGAVLVFAPEVAPVILAF